MNNHTPVRANYYTFFEQLEKDWLKMLKKDNPPFEEQTFFD